MAYGRSARYSRATEHDPGFVGQIGSLGGGEGVVGQKKNALNVRSPPPYSSGSVPPENA